MAKNCIKVLLEIKRRYKASSSSDTTMLYKFYFYFRKKSEVTSPSTTSFHFLFGYPLLIKPKNKSVPCHMFMFTVDNDNVFYQLQTRDTKVTKVMELYQPSEPEKSWQEHVGQARTVRDFLCSNS